MSSTNKPVIRHATEADVPEILALIQALAVYEKSLDAVEATEDHLLSTLSFPSNPNKGYAKTLLIFASESESSSQPAAKAAGMAMYFTNYSTWRGAPGIYLEDLFVRPEYRKRGYGKELLQQLARESQKIGGKRLDWSVLKWNQPSIDFYLSEAIGATKADEWVGMRVDGEALDRLAKGDSE